MGDLEVILPLPKGVDSATVLYSSPPSHPPNPNPSTIGANIWLLAEQATQEVIRHMQPTVVSEQRRKIVVEHVQKLIKGFVSSEVFPYGSVPLKTYLPDGDIDLTAIGIPNSEDALASDVRSILEAEERNKDSEFEVKDVQYIHAEVKLVKCLVENIVVDISFNQLGGLCTLCFLEQVDRFIGKDHLFKRSIILIKAWCYYESRILGAHHGLISTYALETLVLYIFHLFHSFLDGPLAVLYRFLDYYSKFDWDKYCISLQGPVLLSSFPELSVDIFDNDGGDLLLTEEFLRSCVDSFSVPTRGSEANSRTFTKKHLNIVDPLRENNNLGRSVSKGNFYRIRSAFVYGSRKLGRLLLQPAGNIEIEIKMFFMNTMDRHRGGERPDVQDFVHRSSALIELGQADLMHAVENVEKGKVNELSLEHLTSMDYGDLNKEMKNIKISSLDGHEGRAALQKNLSSKQQNSTNVEVNDISFERLTKDHSASRASVSRSTIDSPKTSSSTKEDGILDFRNAYHAPHLFFQPENRTTKDYKPHQINPSGISLSNAVPSTSAVISNCETINSKYFDSCETDSSMSSSTGRVGDFGDGCSSERLYIVGHGLQKNIGNYTNGPLHSLPGPLSSSLDEMSDLSGDFELHIKSLNYALWCQEQIFNTYFVPMHRAPPYSYYRQGKDVWARGSMFTSPLSPRHHFSPAGYSMNLPYISASYTTEETPKPRGTGTYFPNMNYHAYRDRHSPGRIRNSVSVNHLPRPQNNGHVDVSQDASSLGKGYHETIQPQLVLGMRGRLPSRLDAPQSPSRPAFKTPLNTNGVIISQEVGRLEFGSLGHATVDAPTKDIRKKSDFFISHNHSSGFASTASSSPKPAANSNKGRTMPTYQLKDEDFPPLSG